MTDPDDCGAGREGGDPHLPPASLLLLLLHLLGRGEVCGVGGGQCGQEEDGVQCQPGAGHGGTDRKRAGAQRGGERHVLNTGFSLNITSKGQI